MVSLETRNLTFGYRDRAVLREISLTVNPGQFVGLVGPNGSGKTTFLRLVTRILVPQHGVVMVDGKDVQSLVRRDLARVMAAVPQESQVSFPYSVAEIVLMGRAPHRGGLALEDERDWSVVRTAMEQTETTDLAHRGFGELSGGEKQRVIIARALAQEPRLLLLDEPTAFLDLKHQLAIFDLLRNLNQSCGLTIVAVSHDINLVAQYCDSLFLLRDGDVFAAGPPDEIITAENLKAVYEVDVVVSRSPRTGRPFYSL